MIFYMIFRHHAGENGVAVLLPEESRAEAALQTQAYGFNMVASDLMSMTRSIPDTRLDE